MRHSLEHIVDWFIPQSAHLERSDLSVARNFVLTHVLGPLMSQSMCVFLYRTDPDPGFPCYTVIACVCLFWTLPFVLKYTQNIKLAAFLSVELLAFTALFGTYYYGGATSPCLPWLIIALLLGFFYFSEQQLLIVGLFALNVTVFFVAYLSNGFPQIVPVADLAIVSWVSIVSATLYMSWMAIYYSHVMSMRSQIEQETERYLAANEQLQVVKELAEAANRAKSVFLAKMSHELRTPLNAVIGYSELILENIPPGSDATKQKDVRSINAAGRHLLSLVVDVLDLSKIEAETIELNVETFDLARLLDQVVATVKPLADGNGNALTVQHLTALGTMRTDQTKLRQILVNLLSNAAKFTKNGNVTLSVRMDRKPTGTWLDVRVRDTGIGISQGDIGRLFQNFRQVSAATAQHYGGTGLGLALSQKLCTLMGGSIGVTSEIDRGSVFSFCIPAEVAEPLADATSRPDHTFSRADLPADFGVQFS
ncbi:MULTISPECIES: sensor histidine kinase [Methylobacterium]|uniref:histidine kinase n=1 Tax=Methylobacterium thuringiense TaxID=1003091 RepID=A0ABQ4TPD7_9HYPH|nr:MULTISPECIES: ATP-binding protein [Methylobacterium]TXN23476.1 hypothetical protein FV217_06965 [Methylobacterium sp. WL9]GJE57209.1 Sensor histidine kinase RcsC [Methylobacterium thuringiense]